MPGRSVRFRGGAVLADESAVPSKRDAVLAAMAPVERPAQIPAAMPPTPKEMPLF